MVVPICASLMVTWKPRTATLLDQSSKPYASPSWMDTPGRLSTTDVTLVMFDCCRIIGSATTLLEKIRGCSATTLIPSSPTTLGSKRTSREVTPGLIVSRFVWNPTKEKTRMSSGDRRSIE